LEEPAVLACGVALLKALLDLSVDGLALGGILELVSLNNALEVDVQAVAVFFGYGQGHGLATFFFFLLLPAPPPPPPPPHAQLLRCGLFAYPQLPDAPNVSSNIPSGHEVVVVDDLHERLDLGALGNALLAHAAGDLEGVALDASNDSVAVFALLQIYVSFPPRSKFVELCFEKNVRPSGHRQSS